MNKRVMHGNVILAVKFNCPECSNVITCPIRSKDYNPECEWALKRSTRDPKKAFLYSILYNCLVCPHCGTHSGLDWGNPPHFSIIGIPLTSKRRLKQTVEKINENS